MTKELNCRKCIFNKKAGTEDQINKKDIRDVKNQKQNSSCKSYPISNQIK